MSKILSNPVVCLGLLLLFAAAIGVNMIAGTNLPAFGSNPLLQHPDVESISHSPIPPPDPWEDGRAVAHSPIPPPDPWEDPAV